MLNVYLYVIGREFEFSMMLIGQRLSPVIQHINREQMICSSSSLALIHAVTNEPFCLVKFISCLCNNSWPSTSSNDLRHVTFSNPCDFQMIRNVVIRKAKNIQEIFETLQWLPYYVNLKQTENKILTICKETKRDRVCMAVDVLNCHHSSKSLWSHFVRRTQNAPGIFSFQLFVFFFPALKKSGEKMRDH